MLRKSLMATIALTLAVLTSGCMKFNMDLTVNKDDTVQGSMIIAFSNEALDLANSMGGSSSLDTNTLIQKQDGMTTEPFKDDKFTGTKVTFSPKKFSEFSTGTVDSLKFTRTGDIVSVSGALDLSGGDPTTFEQAQANPMTAGLLKNFDISIRLTLPGKVTSTSGVVSGNTVTFKGTPGAKLVIDAKSDQSPTSDSSMLIFGGVAVAAVAVGVVLFLRSRKGKVVETQEVVE